MLGVRDDGEGAYDTHAWRRSEAVRSAVLITGAGDWTAMALAHLHIHRDAIPPVSGAARDVRENAACL